VDLSHVYFVSDHLDIGDSRLEPHGTGWPITANITQWAWRE
jgi:peptide/nickel transport system substrate-binding protein